MARDLGDFQTPPALVTAVLHTLQEKKWSRVLEPTCGQGNFIAGLLALPVPPQEIQGIEIQSDYVQHTASLAQYSQVSQVVIQQANIFNLRLDRDLSWKTQGPLLVVGNPPWITNAALGTLGSRNVPHKTNLKRLSGYEAMTGASNFDIAEYIWLKLMRELAEEKPTIALLCKTSVARNILHFAATTKLPVHNATIRNINAKKWFGAAVDACLLCVDVGTKTSQYEALVYESLTSTAPSARLRFTNGNLVFSDLTKPAVASFEGISPLTWHQGIKHDAAPVVELIIGPSSEFYNKQGEHILVEPEYIYPLLKSSDLARKGTLKLKRAVILPQKHLGQDTRSLQFVAPNLWDYLHANREVFQRRKSSIYRNQPPFAYFGLGDYSFAPYKVAISGMYKTPIFRAIGPVEGKPVMFDDTCYFLACVSPYQAALIASLLNDPESLDFLNTIVFWDAKRPMTKKLLQRIDLLALLRHIERQPLLDRAEQELRNMEIVLEIENTWPQSLEKLLLSGTPMISNMVQLSLLEAF